MTALEIKNLCKSYEKFSLKDVGFSIQSGEIRGFIGRNGAGKTTTLKSILNLVHPDSGEIIFFGAAFQGNEKDIKQRIGYAVGGTSYYKNKTIKDIVKVTKLFYKDWNEEQYRHYLEKFSLDENKRLHELSEGMKVKFNLTLALSHGAELLILDEPTSGLDPVSRDELLDIFLSLAEKGVAILFSTHITSDLEKCADSITYIKNGEIIATDDIEKFTDSYRLVTLDEKSDNPLFLGVCKSKNSFTALIRTSDSRSFDKSTVSKPTLETIMVHLEKEAD